MALMEKIKEIIPWKRKSVETHEVMSLRDDINHLFDRFLMSPFETGWPRLSGGSFGIDMEETEERVIIRAEVPGLDPKRLNVTVRNGMLQMSYENEEEWRQSNGVGSGRRYAAFHRSIALPEGVDASKAEATCKHGILTVRVPWTVEAKRQSRRIVVAVE
jgi:HSP20 family protein